MREELAGLVADTLAALEALQSDAAPVVPVGDVPGLAPSGLPPLAARLAPQVASPVAPRPQPAPRPTPVAPRPAVAPSVQPPPAVPAARPPLVLVPPETLAPTAALFGDRWAKALRDPGDELARVAHELGSRCGACGERPPAWEGSPRARLAVVAAPFEAEAAMFEKMIVHVLLLERSDVFVLPAPACATCRGAVARLAEVVRPRVVLAMGAAAAGLVSGGSPGKWGKWAGIDTLTTFHPTELAARPKDKRAAMEHLKDMARRI